MEFHEAAEIFPLDEENLQSLSDDIGRNGQLKPIEVLDGKILDGRRRFKACKLAGVEPEFKSVKVDHPVSYVLSLNLHRRHLNAAQLSMVAARAKPMFEEIAKERMVDGGKEAGKGRPKQGGANLPHPNGEIRAPRSRDMAAEAVGVGGRTVDFATKVLNDGVPELITAVDKGKIAVSRAAEIAKLPAKQQVVEMNRVDDDDPEEIEEEKQAEIKQLGKGIILAEEAINCLNRIPKNDALRRRGLQRVTDWIKRNQ